MACGLFSCRITACFHVVYNVHVYACSYVKLYVYMYMYVIRFILQIGNLQLTDQNAGFVTAMLHNVFRHAHFVMCGIVGSGHGNC